jgi:hypothetical protein
MHVIAPVGNFQSFRWLRLSNLSTNLLVCIDLCWTKDKDDSCISQGQGVLVVSLLISLVVLGEFL